MTDSMLLADGFDDAVIGVAVRCGQPDVVAYSVEKCLEILQQRDKMTYDNALEYFEFNVQGAWVGETTPIWVWLSTAEDIRAQ